MEIEKVTCLCLDQRKDEWKALEQDIRSRGLPYERFLAGDGKLLANEYNYDYVDDTNPPTNLWGYGREGYKHHHYNAFQCHQRMIEKAKNDGVKNVLFLEDDVYFTHRFDAVWNNIKDKLDDFEWDFLYLGWWVGDENDVWNRYIEDEYAKYGSTNIIPSRQIGGLHGVLIKNTVFDKILSLPPIDPIDSQLNRSHHFFGRSYIVTPKLLHIKSTYSYCEGSVINRKSI